MEKGVAQRPACPAVEFGGDGERPAVSRLF